MSKKPVARQKETTKDATAKQNESRNTARFLLRPSVNHAVTLQKVLGRDLGETTIAALVDELAGQCRRVIDGEMGRPEALLTAQAHTLDAMFNDLARLAYRNLDKFEAAERLFRLAFKAQSQSRATIETLGLLKNPRPTIIAQQANVTGGPQQVNNGDAAAGFARSTRAHAGNSENQRNKVLEHQHGERLDTGTTGGTVSGDSPLEAVGTRHRPADR